LSLLRFSFFSKDSLVENILGVSIAWVVLAFLLLIFWNYRGLNITINDESLFVTYGRFDKKSFLLKEVVSCKKTKSLISTSTFAGELSVKTSIGSNDEIEKKAVFWCKSLKTIETE
jgi:hypothetical protein